MIIPADTINNKVNKNNWVDIGGGAAGVVVVAAGGDWVINRVFPAVIVEGSRNRRM